MSLIPARLKRDLAITFSKELPKYFTKREVAEILDCADNPRDHLLINLLWQTGARVSELLDVRINNIDFYAKIIKISTLKQKPKNGSLPFRIIPIKGDIIGEIGAYIGQRGLRKEDKLFRITRQRAYQIVVKACGKARIDRERSHPHTFRHSFAIHCVLNGVPVLVLKTWLGHKDVMDTLIYTQVLAQDTRQFIDQMVF